MKTIEARPDTLVQLMYGLFLPAVGGTVFWYLIQHVVSGRLLQTLTCSVIVYYFALHFLAGQQLDPSRYGKVGFAIDLVVISAVEALFYAVDGLPQHLGLGMVSILVIMAMLLAWSVKTARSHGHRATIQHGLLVVGVVLVGSLWFLGHRHHLSEHYATLIAVVVLAIATTVFLAPRPRSADGTS